MAEMRVGTGQREASRKYLKIKKNQKVCRFRHVFEKLKDDVKSSRNNRQKQNFCSVSNPSLQHYNIDISQIKFDSCDFSCFLPLM